MNKEYDFSKGERGPVIKSPKGKTRITISIWQKVQELICQMSRNVYILRSLEANT